MRNDFLVTDHLQNVADRLRKLAEGDDAFVVSKAQVKGNALRHMIG